MLLDKYIWYLKILWKEKIDLKISYLVQMFCIVSICHYSGRVICCATRTSSFIAVQICNWVATFSSARTVQLRSVLVWLRVSIKWSSTLDFVRESSTKSFPNQVLSLAPIGREILPPTNERPRWSCSSQSGEVAVTRAAAITAPQPGGETQQRREET